MLLTVYSISMTLYPRAKVPAILTVRYPCSEDAGDATVALALYPFSSVCLLDASLVTDRQHRHSHVGLKSHVLKVEVFFDHVDMLDYHLGAEG